MSILRKTANARGFSAVADADRAVVQVSFDYPGHRQGALIEVLHTGDNQRICIPRDITGLRRGIHEVRPRQRLDMFPFGLLLAMVLMTAAITIRSWPLTTLVLLADAVLTITCNRAILQVRDEPSEIAVPGYGTAEMPLVTGF